MTTRSERVKLLWQNSEYRSHQLASRAGGPVNKIDDVDKTKVICESCKKEFLVLPSRVGIRKYCSKHCRIDARRGRPNLKNRGRIPSKRAGSGISGIYRGKLFRSLYELSFMINVVERMGINVEYESMKIPLGNGRMYIPDFVSHTEKVIYEIKYEKALTQPKIVEKIHAAVRYAEQIGYRFEIYTEKQMSVLSFEDVCSLVKLGQVVLHKKKNGGVHYRTLMKKLEMRTQCRSV